MNQKVYKQELFGYIMFGIIIAASIFLLIATWHTAKEQNVFMLFALAAGIVYFLVLLVNYSKTQIIIDDLFITYKTLFKEKQFKLGDIVKIESSAKLEGITNQGGVKGKYLLVLHTRTDKMEILIKAFSRKNLKELATLLITKCSSAEIDNQTRKMTEGKMPSMFFKHQ